MKNLEGLFEHFLKDIYYAEQQILKALPKMAEKAESSELRDAFEHHKSETEEQIENLKQVFEMCDIEVEGEKCEAIEGILKEGEQIMSEADNGDTRDAGMIAAGQAVEHYEIQRYGTLVSWAKQLGKDDCARLLQQNLDQEHSADDKLNKLAENRLNKQAA